MTNKLIQVGIIKLGTFESSNRVYSPNGICPTIITMGGGNRQPKVLIIKETKNDKT